VVGDAAGQVKLRKLVFTASAAHCSAGRLLIELDGVKFGKMRLVVGNETSTLRKHRTLGAASTRSRSASRGRWAGATPARCPAGAAT
jgi:hypothetical protein